MLSILVFLQDRLKGISDKALEEATEVIHEGPNQSQTRYSLRGGKLFALLAVFVGLAVICVLRKLKMVN